MQLAQQPPARQFVADAHAHKKFVLYNDAALQIFEAVGMQVDGESPGYLKWSRSSSANEFVERIRAIRCWERA